MLKKIIIGPAYPLRGGISESNEALCNSFKEMKENVRIVSYKLQYPKFLFPGKNQRINNVYHTNNNSIHLINTLNPLSWIKTAKYIVREKPAYVIVRYWHPYFALCLGVISRIIRQNSISVFAWIDNPEPHEPIPFQNILTSFFLNSCDKFLVMSEVVKQKLIKYKATRNREICFCPHPVYNVFGKSIDQDVARKKLSNSNFPLTNKDKCILFFGLIRKYKGLDLLIEVMASPKIRKMNIKKIQHLKLGNSILIHDYYIPNEDVAHYFSAIDIVVQPYLSATQSGVSMVAYNFNKPVLLTNVGGLSEYVNHKVNGYLVDVKKESIVLALEDYYLNNRKNSFVNSIKNHKNIYSWKKLAQTFNSLYEKHENI